MGVLQCGPCLEAISLCLEQQSGVGVGEGKEGGASEVSASLPGPGRLPLPRKEKRKKAVGVTGLGGWHVVTEVGRVPTVPTPHPPAAGAWNFLLAGRAHPPVNGNNPWHLTPEVCKVFDNQALLSSLPHPQPSTEGKPRQVGRLSKPRTWLCPWKMPVVLNPDHRMSELREPQGRGLSSSALAEQVGAKTREGSSSSKVTQQISTYHTFCLH